MKKKLKLFFDKLLAFIPHPLPQGLTEYQTWSDSIISLYGLPNNDSVKFSIAVMILHLGENHAYVSKALIGKKLMKAAANQIVSQVIQDLKHKQIAEQEALKAAQEAPKTPNDAL